MKLEQQVCSLDLAKRLKELGVRQESAFYWEQHWTEERGVMAVYLVQKKRYNTADCTGVKYFSAFTVAELGEMLPSFGSSFRDGGQWHCANAVLEIEHPSDLKEGELHFQADTEADARAKMFIYLIEKGMVKCD